MAVINRQAVVGTLPEDTDTDASDSSASTELDALKAAQDRLGQDQTSDEEMDEKKPSTHRTLAHSGDPTVTNPDNAAAALQGKDTTNQSTLSAPLSVSQHLINNNDRLKQLQLQGQAQAAPLLAQAAQTQVTPEQLQGQQRADTITNALRIADQGIRAASTTQNKTYESPAAQKVYEDLISGRQKQLEQQQAVSNSLQQRGLVAQQVPLAQAQALQQAQAEGTKLSTEQAMAPIDIGKAAIGLKQAQQTAPLEVEHMQNVVDKGTLDWQKEHEDLDAQDRPLTNAEIKGWADVGVPLRPGAKVRDLGNAYQLGGLQVKQTIGANKTDLQTSKMDTAQTNAAAKAYDADKTVQGANLALSNASELKRLANMTDNEVAQSGAQLLKARTLLGNARMSQFFANSVGMQSYAGKFQNLLDLKAKGQMSPEQQRELNQLADDTQQEAQRQLKERGDYYSNQFSNSRTSAETLKGKMTGQPISSNSMTRIQASDGSLHDVPDVEAAKKIDPGLQVIGQ